MEQQPDKPESAKQAGPRSFAQWVTGPQDGRRVTLFFAALMALSVSLYQLVRQGQPEMQLLTAGAVMLLVSVLPLFRRR